MANRRGKPGRAAAGVEPTELFPSNAVAALSAAQPELNTNYAGTVAALLHNPNYSVAAFQTPPP
eukprot:2535367-Rhodomonas_salina.1